MNAAPQTLADLKSAIADQHSVLSKRLRQVAQYVMDNPNAIAFGTVAVIAKDASVHPSTLVRFANAFGYSGFSEMQRLFQQKLIQESPGYTERSRIACEELGDKGGDTPLQLLTQFAGASAVALEQLCESISEQDLERAVDILAAADATHVVGVRRAFVVATYFASALRHINRRAYLIDGVGGMYAEQGSAIGSKDAIIVTSFQPYASESRDVAKAAVERGVPLILITDSQLSPLAGLASVCFVVRDAEVHGFRALGSTLCLVQALSISLAYRLGMQRITG